MPKKSWNGRRRGRPTTGSWFSSRNLSANTASVAGSEDLRSRITFAPHEDDDDDSDCDGVESEQGDVKDEDNGSVVPRPISAGQSQSAATPAGNADLKSRATFGTAPSTKADSTELPHALPRPEPMGAAVSFSGIRNLPELPKTVLQYLSDGRFTFEPVAGKVDLELRALRNLVALFQALILFEDCLTSASRNEKPYILAKLQSALGIPIRTAWDAKTVRTISKVYMDARQTEIVATLRDGALPAEPDNHLVALLLRLIDRSIVFKFQRKSQPIGPIEKVDAATQQELVAKRANALSKMISTGSEYIWHDFAYMAACETQVKDLGAPWDDKAWLNEFLGADFEMPKAEKWDEEDGHAAILEALDGPRSLPPTIITDDEYGKEATERETTKRKRSGSVEGGEEGVPEKGAKRQKCGED